MAAGFRIASTGVATGVIFMFCGAGAMLVAREYGLGSFARVGPGFFPMLLGGGLALTGLIITVLAFVQGEHRPATAVLRPLFCVLAAVLFFAVVADRWGIAPAAFGATILAMLGDRTNRIVPMLVSAVCLTALCVVVFVVALDVPLKILVW